LIRKKFSSKRSKRQLMRRRSSFRTVSYNKISFFMRLIRFSPTGLFFPIFKSIPKQFLNKYFFVTFCFYTNANFKFYPSVKFYFSFLSKVYKSCFPCYIKLVIFTFVKSYFVVFKWRRIIAKPCVPVFIKSVFWRSYCFAN